MALFANFKGKALVVLVVLAALSAAWYLGSPLFVSQTVAESFPVSTGTDLASGAAGSVVLSQGGFTDADAFHKGEGVAKLYRLSDGSRLLRLEGFKVTNGPDLHVLLAANPAPKDRRDLEQGGYYNLGKLKGNIGDQNYQVPPDVAEGLAKSVVIYCLPFHVVFSTATLMP